MNNQEIRTQKFQGHEFKVIKGQQHPDYSFDTFEVEEKDFRDKYWTIKQNDIVFDIGASYGSYTLTACAMGGKVFAFEPEKTVFPDLVNNITINDWHSRCLLFNVGMWSSITKVNMKDYAPHWPVHTISSLYDVETIDHMAQISQVNKINWIKIDVEGAEEHVIKGGLETIKKFKPTLLVECHNFLDKELSSKIKELLLSIHTYRFEEISRPGGGGQVVTVCAYPNKKEIDTESFTPWS